MTKRTETLEGYVVDIACLRKYPQDELLERARAHTRACSLEGHCVESGYGLVAENGRVALLDAKATPKVLEAVRGSRRERGIRLSATRADRAGEWKTLDVREAPGPST